MSASDGRREIADIYSKAVDLLTNPDHTRWIAPLLLIGEAILCALIIRTVAYTEIDWIAYMQQVEQYLDGEMDYTKIKGATGPLVYPALHVYIYRILHLITRGGESITLAQVYFLFLYVVNLGFVMASYSLARVPPYVLPMLILSKRMHSIYVLRCFNDCFAMGALFIAIFMWQRKNWTEGTIAFACGLGIKMNLLLVLPAALVILYQAVGPTGMWRQLLILTQVQVLIGLPFMRRNARGYLSRAFDFSRQFKYEWTVNWKFVSEEVFLSRGFAIGLLVLHVSLLILFVTTRWLKPLNRSPKDLIKKFFTERSETLQAQITQKITPDYILTTILTANAIGMLCARSLHYQFFSWIGWGVPFLLWRSKLNPLLMYVLWIGEELAWNQYPANELSSKIVVGVLAVVVLEVWLATDEDEPKKTEQQRNLEAAQRVGLINKTKKKGSARISQSLGQTPASASASGSASASTPAS